MIEIKENKVVNSGYSLEDLIAVERSNAMLCCQIEQLHRAYMDRECRYELPDKISLIFGWDKPKDAI